MKFRIFFLSIILCVIAAIPAAASDIQCDADTCVCTIGGTAIPQTAATEICKDFATVPKENPQIDTEAIISSMVQQVLNEYAITPEPAEEEEVVINRPENNEEVTETISPLITVTPSQATGLKFDWVYTGQNPNVTFSLTFSVSDISGQAMSMITPVTCSNFICHYEANPQEFTWISDAEISWSVYAEGMNEELNGGSFIMMAQPSDAPQAEVLPAEAPVPEYPQGNGTHTKKTGFYWKQINGIAKYAVSWKNDKGDEGRTELAYSEANCPQGHCIAYDSLPRVGKYTWTVEAIHPDGSVTMSDEIEFTVSADAAVPKTLDRPKAIANHNPLNFQWSDVGNGVTEYRLQVIDRANDQLFMDKTYRVGEIYVGNNSCYIESTIFFPEGKYAWRVRAYYPNARSNWSDWSEIETQCDFCLPYQTLYGSFSNHSPAPIKPVGTILDREPSLQWRSIPGTSYYLIKITDSTGNVLEDLKIPGKNCTEEYCTFDSDFIAEMDGTFKWTVEAYGPTNGLWGSAAAEFTLITPEPLSKVEFISPANGNYLDSARPMIIWSDLGEGVAYYHIQIFDNAHEQLFEVEYTPEDAWCDGKTCSILFDAIPDADNYRISITPYNDYLAQLEGRELIFSKGAPSIKLSRPKEGAHEQARPFFRWALKAGEGAQYLITLTDQNGTATLYTGLTCGINGVTCEGGEAFFSPAAELAPGNYSATLSITGASTQGQPTAFTVY